MKRTFRRSDGTEEVLEGTAEELAEYERKLKREQAEPQQPRPDILKGLEVDGEPVTEPELDWVRNMRKMLRDPNTFRVPDQLGAPFQPYLPAIPWQPLCPWPNTDRFITGEPCRWCGKYNCYDTHIICGDHAGLAGNCDLPTTLTCSSFIVTGEHTLRLIEQNPERNWSFLTVCGGGLRS